MSTIRVSGNLLLVLAVYINACLGCFFPSELVGSWLIQTDGHTTSTFSEISIEADAIPPWGRCHARRGNNVILKDSTGGEDCMRCFHLTLKAPNVIQIHTEGLSKCYTKEEAVRATCPDDRAVHERKFKEIMLYRKQDTMTPPEPVFCPISGKFRFTYTARGGEFRCDQSLSELSNCPAANVLTGKFRQCSFPDMDVKFLCLGDWEGTNNDRYLALMDLRGMAEERPRFRCGMYRVDPLTGRMFVSLSADSTCHNQLRSATDGYESLILTPFPEKSPPGPVLQAHCRFPDWAQGPWEGTQVVRNVLLYRDPPSLQRISLTCLRKEEGTREDRFIVFSSTHCGEESYNCVWLKRRSQNVLEFQIGSQPSRQYSDSLCHDLQFSDDLWTTQGRVKGTGGICPITGDYTGVLPENPGLCAKVASDCNNPDVMFYTVADCHNKSQVFEEREYRCLGSWEDERTGVTFTYTQRREMDGFQCFSGKVVNGGREAYIKEAGVSSCIRGEDPIVYGMKITRHATCPDLGLSPHGPRYPTVAPPDDDLPYYSPVPDNELWRSEKAAKNRKSPTRSTKEDEDEENSAISRHGISTSLFIVISLAFVYQQRHVI
ncbi:hypothetical protein JTE90_012111 [Oedothorax gibbosus]|uniref:Uncharacterized protein n=1 Tax=Oedothorax gibbosus TaxID=931172 RepID=A0AAV6UWT7_9ARAC|nr:hypothetical protein JTE90_012111 [Oedothorax gibbosus]